MPGLPPVHDRVAAEIRDGARAAISGDLAPPPAHARVRRFLHGAALPFTVLRAALRDRRARTAHLHVLGIELAVLGPVGVACVKHSEHFDALLEARAWGDRFRELLALVGFAYLAITVLEWIAIALANDYHDAVAVIAAMATGVPCEPLAAPPRVRVNFGWLWIKAKRRVRGLALIAMAAPPLAPIALIPVVGEALFSALMSAWAAYWLAVFALAGSFVAWEVRDDAREPFFLRAMNALVRIPVIGWIAWPYVAVCKKLTRGVRPACVSFEEAPFEAAGLAVARAVAGVPIVWLALRPFFGVAATHALLGARAAANDQPSPPPPS